MTDDFVVLARRRKSQAPPPHWMWDAITNPLSTESRGWAWFEPRDGEQAPEILEATSPSRVVWSSIWLDRPDLRVEFAIEPDEGPGSFVTWTLFGPDGSLAAEDVRQRRYRMNQLVNGILRDFFDL